MFPDRETESDRIRASHTRRVSSTASPERCCRLEYRANESLPKHPEPLAMFCNARVIATIHRPTAASSALRLLCGDNRQPFCPVPDRKRNNNRCHRLPRTTTKSSYLQLAVS